VSNSPTVIFRAPTARTLSCGRSGSRAWVCEGWFGMKKTRSRADDGG
jgi:hypothetical protein